MARVSQLESSAQTWKVRVSESDATKFTVAHKLAMSASASSVPSTTHTNGSYSSLASNVPPITPSKLISTSVPTSSPSFMTGPPTQQQQQQPLSSSSSPSSGGSSGIQTPSTPLRVGGGITSTSPLPAINVSSADETSPSSAQRRERKTPLPKIFKSRTGGNLPELMPQTPVRPDYRRTISTPVANGAGEQ